MKKALYTLALLMIVLLPSLGQAQERTGNETVPAYNVWLPVVRMPPIPSECLPTGVGAGWSSSRYPDFDPIAVLSYGFYNFTYESWYSMLDEAKPVKREVTIAYDSQMQNIVFQSRPYPAFMLPELKINIGYLTPGQTYYAKFEYECLGFSVRTPVHEFTAPVPYW